MEENLPGLNEEHGFLEGGGDHFLDLHLVVAKRATGAGGSGCTVGELGFVFFRAGEFDGEEVVRLTDEPVSVKRPGSFISWINSFMVCRSSGAINFMGELGCAANC